MTGLNFYVFRNLPMLIRDYYAMVIFTLMHIQDKKALPCLYSNAHIYVIYQISKQLSNKASFTTYPKHKEVSESLSLVDLG